MTSRRAGARVTIVLALGVASAVACTTVPGADEPDEKMVWTSTWVEPASPAPVEPLAVPEEAPLAPEALDDDELARRWVEDPASLGSIALGRAAHGRLVGAVRFPAGEGWTDPRDEAAYATEETVEAMLGVLRAYRAAHPDAPPVRVSDLSAREGGRLAPHRTHQTGRDVDLGFVYPPDVRLREDRENQMDVARTWDLLRALVTEADVQTVLADRRILLRLRAHARRIGEDEAWLASLFDGRRPLVRHAEDHRDHFHVRLYNPRAQEVGRRLLPHLALRPDWATVAHRVEPGDNLIHLARRHGTTVAAIRGANGIDGSRIVIGDELVIPLGKYFRGPPPPPVVVPPRRLPPEQRRLVAQAQAR